MRLLEVGENCFLSSLCLNGREGDDAPQARARLLKKRGCSSGEGGEVHGILAGGDDDLRDVWCWFHSFFLAFAGAEVRR